MKTIAIIGGTGAGALFVSPPSSPQPGAASLTESPVHSPVESSTESPAPPCTTPFGPTSAPIRTFRAVDGRTTFRYLARHGIDGRIPPHAVNYRANIWALRAARPDFLIAINAVGGIAREAAPGRICVPDQLIDYTWGRAHTFSDGPGARLQHVEFTRPFDDEVRDRLIGRARDIGLDVLPTGTYGVMQGPRLETAAEIDRLERDGCDIVGMTAMPEAALARELGLAYASCAVVVNHAAGRGEPGDGIHEQMQRTLDGAMARVGELLHGL